MRRSLVPAVSRDLSTFGYNTQGKLMIRQILAAMLLLLTTAGFAPRQDRFTKTLQPYKGVVPGIDFYAPSRSAVALFENPVREAEAKLSAFLGRELARGAVAICTTLDQRDSVSERRLLKMGYRWVLILTIPESREAGGSQLVASSVQKIGNAILMTTLAPEVEFRSSRVEDMGRSPLSDWLDVGIVSYVTGSGKSNLGFLQDRLEEAFPLEDVISMSRPFVAPAEMGGERIQLDGNFGGVPGRGGPPAGVFVNGGSGGSGTLAQRQADPGHGSGGAGNVVRQSAASGVAQVPGQDTIALPKDVQDRMFFDAEAASFFLYIIEKLGTEKCRALIQASLEKKDLHKLLTQDNMLGPDFDAIEKDWQNWLKNQKVAR